MKKRILVGLLSMICPFVQAQTHEILFSGTYDDTQNSSIVQPSQVLFADDQNNGKALDFRGNLNNIVNWDNVAINTSSNFSISLWTNIEAINTNELQYILTSRHDISGQEKGGVSLGIDTEGKVFVNMYKSNALGVFNFKSENPITTQAWHHIVLSKSDSIVQLFLDSSLITSDTLQEDPLSHNFYTIGAIYNQGNTLFRELNGQVDEIQMFTESLSTTDISNLYNGTPTSIEPSHKLTFDNSQIVDEKNTSDLYGINEPMFTQDRNDVNENALQFYDPLSFVKIQEVDIVLNKDFGIQFWVKPETYKNQYLMSNTVDNDGSSTGGIDIKLSSSSKVIVDIYSSGGNLISSLTSTTALALNSWTQITLTREGNHLVLLVNNSLESSTLIDKTIDNNPVWTVGSKINSKSLPSSSGAYEGGIDDIVMYNNALKLSDIILNEGFNHNMSFDQGTFTDDLGNASLTPENNVSFTDDRNNISSSAVEGGIDKIVQVSDVNLSLNKDFTVSHWIYLNPNSTDIQYTFTSRHNTLGQERGGLDMGINKNGTFISTFRNINTNHLSLISDNAIPTSQWNQLVIQRKGETIYMYLNNQLIKQGDLKGEPNSPTFYTIGAMYNPNNDIIRELNGKVDDIQIYQYALNSSELTSLYNNGVITSNISSQVVSSNIAYPNPADDVLYVSPEYLELYNSLGELVLTSENTISIDVSHLSSGLYFVNQEGKKQSIIIK